MFFGLRNIRLGMAIIGVLWVTVLSAMLALWQVDTLAGILFLVSGAFQIVVGIGDQGGGAKLLGLALGVLMVLLGAHVMGLHFSSIPSSAVSQAW